MLSAADRIKPLKIRGSELRDVVLPREKYVAMPVTYI